jgi:hypothetical protein
VIGFGLDSGIEALAAFAAWRFLRGGITPETEEKLTRIVRWTFLALAACVGVESAHDLITREEVAPPRLGLAVTSLS